MTCPGPGQHSAQAVSDPAVLTVPLVSQLQPAFRVMWASCVVSSRVALFVAVPPVSLVCCQAFLHFVSVLLVMVRVAGACFLLLCRDRRRLVPYCIYCIWIVRGALSRVRCLVFCGWAVCCQAEERSLLMQYVWPLGHPTGRFLQAFV